MSRLQEPALRFRDSAPVGLGIFPQAVPQNETTPFYPGSPYAAAKRCAYWIVVSYRETYGIHASDGILFNHESPIRGETFLSVVATLRQQQRNVLLLASASWG